MQIDVLFLPEGLHKPELDLVLKLIKDNKQFKDKIKKFESFKVEVIHRNKKLYILNYINGQFHNLEQISVNKVSGDIGKRSSYDISLLPDKEWLEGIKLYFGQGNPSSISLYLLKKDFHYTFCRWSDSIGTSMNNVSQNSGVFGKWSGEGDDSECNNQLIRSLGSDDIPAHDFIIHFAVIERALKQLSKDYYIYIHGFLFPELALDIPDSLQNDYQGIRNVNVNDKEYRIMRRKLNKALIGLKKVIVSILSEKR